MELVVDAYIQLAATPVPDNAKDMLVPAAIRRTLK
jgi:hypothetical protein